MRALTSDVLAAICYVSPTEGHKAVLAALSDYRVEFDERFRFQELITSLRLPEVEDDSHSDGTTYANDEDGVWEARSASMALVNALTNFPDSLEDRISLREEFTRRGLNEVIVVRPFLTLQSNASSYSRRPCGTYAHRIRWSRNWTSILRRSLRTKKTCESEICPNIAVLPSPTSVWDS